MASPQMVGVAEAAKHPNKGMMAPKPMIEIHWPMTWSPDLRAKRE